MSIATPARRTHASVRTAAPSRVQRPLPTRDEQLRDVRALLRHFVLAFTAAAAFLYATIAAGPGI